MLTRRLKLPVRAGAILGFAAMVALMAPSPASAAFKLRVTHSPDTFGLNTTVTDGGGGDASGLAGVVLVTQNNGGTEALTATGTGKPIFPTTLDLNAVLVSQIAETVTIELTDTDYPATFGPTFLIGNVGGTTTGTVSFKACVDPSNAEFGTGGTCIDHGPFTFGGGVGSLGFHDHEVASQGPLGTYSFTLIATIVHAAGDISSFNYQADSVSSVPEPSQIVMLGAGLLGMAYVAMRRRQATNL